MDGIGYCSYCRKIHSAKEELYDLRDDPFEEVNILGRKPTVHKGLKEEIDDLVNYLTLKRQREIKRRHSEQTKEDPYIYSKEEEEKIEKRLRSFGYID